MRLRRLLSLVGVVPFIVLCGLMIFPVTSTKDAFLSEESGPGSDHFPTLQPLHPEADYDGDEDHSNFDDMPAFQPNKFPELPFCDQLGQQSKQDSDSGSSNDGTENSSTSNKIVKPQLPVIKGRHTLVATLDGQLSLLDQSGHMLWTIKTGQVFSSTISTLPVHENGKWIHLIPSLTGSLYKYDGDSLHPMPLNAEVLLHRSFKLSNDVVMSGGKEVRTYGIDLTTGTIRYECGFEGCSSATTATESSAGSDVILVVKKQMQTVRAIDSITGSEKWNFSVATHELALAGVREGCYEGEHREGVPESMIKVIIPDGLVMGAGPDNHSVWQHKFDHPISQTWVIENGRLSIVDPIKHSILDQSPALYIGQHDHQLYVQESQITAERLEDAISYYVGKREILPKRLEIGWKPSYSNHDTHSQALAPYQQDFSGLYLYDSDEIASKRRELDASLDEDEESSYMIDLPSIWYWWKEVLGFSLILAVVLNALLMWPVARFVRADTARRMLRFFQPLRNKQDEDQIPEEREETALLAVLPAPRRSRTRTISTSSNASQNFLEDGQAPFVSQYLKEFEPIECLGRGGFGVVFEAKKKIDDRHYAVKRILLPDSEKSRGRVMREVKALAKLDHRNIVRYFNAWIENPPVGWLAKNDKLWNDSLKDTSSGYYPSSMQMISTMDKSRGDLHQSERQRKEFFDVSFPNCESQKDDSFIVFAAEEHSDSARKENIQSVDFSSDTNSRVKMVSRSQVTDNSDSSSGGFGFFGRPTSLRLASVAECSVDNADIENGVEEDEDKNEEDNGVPSDTYLYIQQELCQKRTLQEWLRVTKERNRPQVVQLFAQIVEAVEYIHMNKLIHRDLKPGNIFLASGENMNSEKEAIIVKIGDFGLATTAVSRFDKDSLTPSLSNPPPTQTVNLTGHVGTHMYMSPEQTLNKPYDFKVDIYSLGLIFFELLVPFSTEMERHESLSQIRKMKFSPDFVQEHETEHSIIAEMVNHNPFKRPNASEIKLWLNENLIGRPVKTYSAPTELSVIRSTSSDSGAVLHDNLKNNDRGRRLNKNHSYT